MKKKYELIFAKEFLKEIKALEKDTQVRILRELKILEEQPFTGKRLAGRLRGQVSFRVGEYRVIYSVTEKKIFIKTVGQRSTVYER